MKQSLKYVNFYKRALLRGCPHNFQPDEALALHMEKTDCPSAYITPMFDTGSADTTYNRLSVAGEFHRVKLEVIVAATDVLDVFLEDVPARLDFYLSDPTVAFSKKREVLLSLPHVRMVNAADLLLHELTGRFVWAFVGAASDTAGGCSLEGLRLEFPRYSFTEYFPEIYQQDPFFDRYISVFQSMYLDLEREIDRIPAMLDYESADDWQVTNLAGWLGIENDKNMFHAEQLRQIIREIDLFQGGKGTRVALERIVTLATGIRPRIVEYFQWNRLALSAAQRKLNKTLYGETGNHFCVLLDLTNRFAPLPILQEDLERLIESYSAIGTQHKIVYLRRCSHTDTHCYLDVNSYLSIPEVATVDSVTLGAHITVG